MSYWFTTDTDDSLSKFAQEVTEEIVYRIDESYQEGFYQNDNYSYVYDHHNKPWDKLDFKEGLLNHRVFFTEVDQEFVILEIFDRDNLEYDRHELYNVLRKIDNRISKE